MFMVRRSFPGCRILIVAGYKAELIMDAFPTADFVINEAYRDTNTSKSLLAGLLETGDDSVLWLNGDVVFGRALLPSLLPYIAGQSFVAVDTKSVGDEEVKYSLGADGFISEISKSVHGARGEAVGINYVSATSKPLLIQRLSDCNDDDYFERAIELGIQDGQLSFAAVDVSSHFCVEVDFQEDLERVNQAIGVGRIDASTTLD